MWLCRGTTPSSDYYIDVSPAPSKVRSSSTITITCYEDAGLTVAIPSQVKWTRTHQGWSKKLTDVSHAYVCKPTDIGSIIEGEVTARSSNGVDRSSFTIKFGPITLDPLLRPSVETVIKNSIASFAVSVVSSTKTKEYVLHITDSDLEIKDARTGSNIKSTYSAIEPQFIENLTDPCTMTMMIPRENESDYDRFFSVSQIQKQREKEKAKDNEKEKSRDKERRSKERQNSLKIRFADRESRDLFIIARKAFVVKRQTRLMSIIQNSLDTPISNTNSVDLLIEMSTVRALNQFLARKKELYKNQVDILQEEIENVKNIYQQLLKQKTEHSAQKPRFDPVLSLLDSSDNSKQIGLGGPGNSRSILPHSDQKLVLPVIGEIEEMKEVKISMSSNVMYSQVYPFNDSYSKKTSMEKSAYHKISGRIQRHNTISQKQSSLDSQSILNSLIDIPRPNHIQQPQQDPNFHMKLSQEEQQRQMELRNKEQLYNAWKQEAHKNLILQSKILQLEKEMRSTKIIEVQSTEAQDFIIKENDQLTKLIKQKDGVIRLLVAESNNLKLQLDNNSGLTERYKQRCEFLFKSKQDNRILTSGDLESPEEFCERLTPYTNESAKLMRESARLSDMLKLAFSQDLELSNIN